MPVRAGTLRSGLFIVLLLLGILSMVAPAAAAPPAPPPAPAPGALQAAFTAAAREFGVPERVLLALSYNLSRWDAHAGAPSVAGGYGPMHLIHVDRVPNFDARGDDSRAQVATPNAT